MKGAVATVYAKVAIPQQDCTGSQVEASASCQDSMKGPLAGSEQYYNSIPLPARQMVHTDKAGC